MNNGVWYLVFAVLLALAGCKPEAEKQLEMQDQATVDNLTKAANAVGAMKFVHPSELRMKPVEVELPKTITPDTTQVVLEGDDGKGTHTKVILTEIESNEFLEDDPSPYLEFNVGNRVDPKTYSIKWLKRLQRICNTKTVEDLNMCLLEEIDILVMHVEALEKENELTHKATAKFRKEIKKR